MKKILFGVALLFAAVGCSKSEYHLDEQNEDNLVDVKLNFYVDNLSTKGSGASFGVTSEDNTLNCMDLFVFRTDVGREDYGALEYYKRFSSDECSSSFDFSLELTTGSKRIISIANPHRDTWPNITNLSLIEKEIASLQDENIKNFTMLGVVNMDVTKSTTVSYSLSRLVSRVIVSNIRTKFEGTPYEGSSLKNVKLYLTNVQGQKYIATNNGLNLKILNADGPVSGDIDGCDIVGMIYEDTGVDVSDAGHSTKHYFYCYANSISSEDTNNKFTRLVVEGQINGVTYYYPIPLKDLINNYSYSYDISILRPGSLDPSDDVTMAEIALTCNVLDWQEQSLYNVEF